jgi:hypothetical protein
MPSPLIVYDTATPQFQENRIFDHQYAARFPGALTWAYLSDRVRLRGWQIMTADVYLRLLPKSNPVICISEMVTPYTRRLIEHQVIAALIASGESPNVAWRFYHNLQHHTLRYRHALLFRGMSAHVRRPTQFHPLYWPSDRRTPASGPEWNKRRYLVTVASNKQRFAVSTQRPMVRVRQLLKRMLWAYLQRTDALFRFQDLYQARLDAIRHFAGDSDFRLFGTGWEQRNGLPADVWKAVRGLNPTPVSDKLATMSGFKFALSFENCVFPGYVTEKIFDCFLAGCIPIYFGAPDIADFVPADTFIDLRRFQSLVELDQFLHEMPDVSAQQHLQAARSFMASAAFDKFTVDNAVLHLMSIIEQEAQASR